MITRNGNILFGVTAMNMGPSSSTPNPNCQFKDINNQSNYFSSTSYNISSADLNQLSSVPDLVTLPNYSSDSGLFLYLGSNDNNTSPSVTDYNLDTPFTNTDFTYSNVTLDFTVNGEPIISETFTNNSQSNLIVKEIGLYGKSSSLSKNDPKIPIILLGREVIEPVTVEPGKSINVSFKITYI